MTSQIDAWLEEGLRHYSQGDPARALEAWHRILDVEPAHELTQQYVAYVRQVYHIEAPSPSSAPPSPAPAPAPSSAPSSAPSDGVRAPPRTGTLTGVPGPSSSPAALASTSQPGAEPDVTAGAVGQSSSPQPGDVSGGGVVGAESPISAPTGELVHADGAAQSYEDALVDLSPPVSQDAPRTDRIDLEALAVASVVIPESALEAVPSTVSATLPPSFAVTSPPTPAAPAEPPRKGVVGFDASADWGDLVASAFDVIAPAPASPPQPPSPPPPPPPQSPEPSPQPATSTEPVAPHAAPPSLSASTAGALASPPGALPGVDESPIAEAIERSATPPPGRPEDLTLTSTPVTPAPAEPQVAAPAALPRMSAQNPWAPRRLPPPSAAAAGTSTLPVPAATPGSSEDMFEPPHTPVLPGPQPPHIVAPPYIPAPAAQASGGEPTASMSADEDFDPWQGDSLPSSTPVLSEPMRVSAADQLPLPPPTPSPIEVEIDIGAIPALLAASPAQLAGAPQLAEQPSAPPPELAGFDVDVDFGEVDSSSPGQGEDSVQPAEPPPGPQAAAPGSPAPTIVPAWKRSAIEEIPATAPRSQPLEERVAVTRLRYNDYGNYAGTSPTQVSAPPVPTALPQPTHFPQAPSPPPAAAAPSLAPAADPWEEIDSIAATVDLDNAPSPSATLEEMLVPREGTGLTAWPVAPGASTPALGVEDECEALMRGARELFDLGDFSGSLELVEKALSANPDHDGARAYMQKNEATLLRMYESKLGNLERTPRQLVPPDEVIWMNMHHKAGFILSQVDGMMSYDDLLSISGMSRFETVRILHDLVQQGIIG